MDIKKLRELCEKATPGPWEWQYSEKWGTSVFNDTLGVITAYTNERGNPDITIAEEDLEFIAAARTALPELLDEVEMLRKENQEMVREGLAADVEIVKENMRLIEEVERLRKEVRLLNEKINVIKWSIVDTVGGVSYDGEPTSTLNYLQRLRILVEKENALSLACSQLADVMEVCPADLEWCESRECPGNRGKCWEDYFLEKVRGE